MNSPIRKSAMPFGALIFASLFLIALVAVAVSNVTHAADSDGPRRGRLITIHDRGTEKVILSDADTIGGALKEAGITIDEKDAVEPAVTEKLVASDYQVNIYRARPVIIIDGNAETKVITPYQTADQIAASVGIELYDEDKAVLSRITDILAEGAGLKLTIVRAIPFTFDFYGNVTTARTLGQTVGEMLSEKGISLGKDDRVSPSLGTMLTEGLVVKVWREGKQTITVEEAINFDVEQIENIDQPVGYREIKTPGENGSRNVTYEITIQNGQETNRTEIASITTKQPVKQVEVIGVKGKYTTPTENENITWDFLISNGFSPVQTAGIMGNLMQEHGFQTSDTPGGLGIAQWTGGRRLALLALPEPYNIYTQLGFLLGELKTSGLINTIKNETSMTNVVVIFQNQFERCGICLQDKRIIYAQNILASH